MNYSEKRPFCIEKTRIKQSVLICFAHISELCQAIWAVWCDVNANSLTTQIVIKCKIWPVVTFPCKSSEINHTNAYLNDAHPYLSSFFLFSQKKVFFSATVQTPWKLIWYTDQLNTSKFVCVYLKKQKQIINIE